MCREEGEEGEIWRAGFRIEQGPDPVLRSFHGVTHWLQKHRPQVLLSTLAESCEIRPSFLSNSVVMSQDIWHSTEKHRGQNAD